MNRVFVVLETAEGEGSIILKIFSSRNKAVKYIRHLVDDEQLHDENNLIIEGWNLD